MANSYLSEGDLNFHLATVEVELIGSDTYDEVLLLKKIMSKDVEHLYCCALSMAITGFGNKSFGKYKLKGFLYDVSDVMKKNGILLHTKLNDKIEPDDVTPKRLCRIFRFEISNHLRVTGIKGFLWRKYSRGIDIPSYLCFPGAEHFIDSDNYLKLLEVYKNLDSDLNTTFAPKIVFIYQARNLYVKATS